MKEGAARVEVPSRRFATASRQRRGTLVQSVGRSCRQAGQKGPELSMRTAPAHCHSTKPPCYVPAL